MNYFIIRFLNKSLSKRISWIHVFIKKNRHWINFLRKSPSDNSIRLFPSKSKTAQRQFAPIKIQNPGSPLSIYDTCIRRVKVGVFTRSLAGPSWPQWQVIMGFALLAPTQELKERSSNESLVRVVTGWKGY